MPSTFLTAEWRNLIMANYVVEPALLRSYLPHHTELDFWQGRCYVSLVGFMFCNTKVMGLKIPFHTNFEEVNLRFYVKYKQGNEWKRGVTFIKEIVPRHAITFIANILYKENYVTMPMQHQWLEAGQHREIKYSWKGASQWNSFSARTEQNAVAIQTGSEEEFITEHYWGYTRLSAQATSEYGVEHPRWNTYPVLDYTIDCNLAALYGKTLADALIKPTSVLVADGSEILVKKGRRLR